MLSPCPYDAIKCAGWNELPCLECTQSGGGSGCKIRGICENKKPPVRMKDCIRTVKIVDTTKPQISLKGEKKLTLEAGSDLLFKDPGVNSFDTVDGSMPFFEAQCIAITNKLACDGNDKGLRNRKGEKECLWVSKTTQQGEPISNPSIASPFCQNGAKSGFEMCFDIGSQH